MRPIKLSNLILIAVILLIPVMAIAEEDENEWNNALKSQYFSSKTIDESGQVIDLETPVRAEDPALVPIKINSKISQTPDKYIKKILVLVDKNPFPYVGEFEFTPKSGKADLAMRIRVNTYSYVRAIAEIERWQPAHEQKIRESQRRVFRAGRCRSRCCNAAPG